MDGAYSWPHHTILWEPHSFSVILYVLQMSLVLHGLLEVLVPGVHLKSCLLTISHKF